MNIIRPGIFNVGISVHTFFTLWNQGMKTLFYVNREELEKIVSRPDNLERLTTNKL